MSPGLSSPRLHPTRRLECFSPLLLTVFPVLASSVSSMGPICPAMGKQLGGGAFALNICCRSRARGRVPPVSSSQPPSLPSVPTAGLARGVNLPSLLDCCLGLPCTLPELSMVGLCCRGTRHWACWCGIRRDGMAVTVRDTQPMLL